MKQPALFFIPHAAEIRLHLIQGTFILSPLLWIRVINQYLPVITHIFIWIIADKVVKGIPAAQNIGHFIHNDVFIMHSSLGFPGHCQIQFIIYFYLHIRMGRKSIKKLIPLQTDGTAHPVYQNLYSDSLLCPVIQNSQQVPCALSISHVKCGKYNSLLCLMKQPDSLIPCALICLQQHRSVHACAVSVAL